MIRSYKKCLSRDGAKKTQKFPYFDALNELSSSNIEYSMEAGVEEEIKSLSGNTLVKKQDVSIEAEDSDSFLLLPVQEKDQWTEQETFSLIEVYKKTKDSIGKVKLYWEIVANELSKIGISKDPKKCMKKLFNLRRTYKKFQEKGKMGSNRFPFMDNLREVFGNSLMFKQEEDGEIIFGEIVDSAFIEEVLWSDEEIRLLLICYAQVKASNYQSKSDVFWELLSAQMGESGVGRSAYECEQKVKGLISSYERSKIEGSFHQFPYYEEIEQLFGLEDEEEEVEYLESDFLIPHQNSEPQNSEEPKIEQKIMKLQEQPIELDEFSEDPPVVEVPPNEACPSNSQPFNSIWKPSQTVYLLNCMENYEKMEDEEEKWKLLALQLKKDQTDVKNKWESLVKSGRLVFKERMDKAQFPYYSYMLELFGEDLFQEKSGNGEFFF